MNKPLTIEELKALQTGDWVWVVYHKEFGDEEFYSCKLISDKLSIPNFIAGVRLSKSSYGKTWVAYKNKEQAEAKGRIVELSNPIIKPWDSTGERGFSISFPRIVEDVEHYDTEIEAEHRLAELTKE